MDTFTNPMKAFAPLGERLHFFESGLHLYDNNIHDIKSHQHDFYYEDMINKVGVDVNLFDSSQVYEIAYEYMNRTDRVKKALEEQIKAHKIIKAEKWNMWIVEVNEYLHQLLAILDAREDVSNAAKGQKGLNASNKCIQLPVNYSITELHTHFKPKHSHSTIAILMHYMSKTGILPPYEQGEYAKIAPIFGFHSKTIAKDIRNLNTESKSDLLKAKTLAEFLLNTINEDLKQATKR